MEKTWLGPSCTVVPSTDANDTIHKCSDTFPQSINLFFYQSQQI